MTKSADKLDQRAKSKKYLELLWIKIVRDRVNSIPFGLIEIVVQDSRVIQISSTERLRLDQLPEGTPPRPNRGRVSSSSRIDLPGHAPEEP